MPFEDFAAYLFKRGKMLFRSKKLTIILTMKFIFDKQVVYILYFSMVTACYV